MDRRYSSSSSIATAETAKRSSAINSSIRLRNGLSSSSTATDPTTVSSVAAANHHRKSFPSTSDVGSSFQVCVRNYFRIPLHKNIFSYEKLNNIIKCFGSDIMWVASHVGAGCILDGSTRSGLEFHSFIRVLGFRNIFIVFKNKK